jgi:polar amino acid transport system substrate-binding protein
MNLFWILIVGVLLFSQPHLSAAEKTFKAIASPFPPLADAALDSNGWFAEICTAALESQGYTVTLSFAPWARALKKAGQGHYDGLLPTYWTEERAKLFVYSVPIEALRTRFFKRKDRTDIIYTGDLTKMKDYSISVGRGHSVSERFDQADFLYKYEVVNNVIGLKMLWNNRVDLLVGDEPVELYHLGRMNEEPELSGIKDGIIFLDPPLQERVLYMAISRNAADYEQKIKDFNLGIRHLIENGAYHDILVKHGVKTQ